MTPRLPFVVLERHTGDVSLLETEQEARFFADEFFDILDSSFSFWDASGRVLSMTEGLTGPRIGPKDLDGLASAVGAYEARLNAEEEVVLLLRAVLRGAEASID